MVRYKIDGMKELKKSLDKLGKVPQKNITASVKKAMNIPLQEAKRNAPRWTGYMEEGLISVGEKTSVKGKKVYRIVFDRNMNDIFQKKNKEGKITGYYPVSQEYGFFARNGKYIPGVLFAHNALKNNTQKVEKTIVQEMKKKIDKELAKGGLK